MPPSAALPVRFSQPEFLPNHYPARTNEPIFTDFTEANEGNEDPFPAYLTHFVPLVTFCSKFVFEKRLK